MVTPEFSLSKFAIQASWAASWALEPAPATWPESSPEEPLSLLPQAATPTASTARETMTANHLEGLT